MFIMQAGSDPDSWWGEHGAAKTRNAPATAPVDVLMHIKHQPPTGSA